MEIDHAPFGLNLCLYHYEAKYLKISQRKIFSKQISLTTRAESVIYKNIVY